jgi:hypothetical protein
VRGADACAGSATAASGAAAAGDSLGVMAPAWDLTIVLVMPATCSAGKSQGVACAGMPDKLGAAMAGVSGFLLRSFVNSFPGMPRPAAIPAPYLSQNDNEKNLFVSPSRVIKKYIIIKYLN